LYVIDKLDASKTVKATVIEKKKFPEIPGKKFLGKKIPKWA